MAKATKENNLWIKITDEDGGFVKSQSVEAHLLFNILKKMEEIRCNQIDIETEIQKLKEE